MGMPENQHTPLWKQLLGAATGSVVALLLYGGFVVVSPNLSVFTAYLSSTFEEKIERLPTDQRSPRTIREDALAWREALGDRARAATAKLQKGENYFSKSSSSSSSSISLIPSMVENQQEEEVHKKKTTASHLSKKQGQHYSEQKVEKNAGPKRKKEKLPSTGVPLWAIGGVAFSLAMSMRYRRELLGNH